MEVSKEFTFDAAHQLVGHCAGCSHVHGHTYKLVVAVADTCKVESGSSKGMIIDFKDLKAIVQSNVLDYLDHKMIFAGDEPLLNIMMEYATLSEKSVKHVLNTAFGATGVFFLGTRTTAENIAEFIFSRLLTDLPGLCYIELYETPTSKVRVNRKDVGYVN